MLFPEMSFYKWFPESFYPDLFMDNHFRRNLQGKCLQLPWFGCAASQFTDEETEAVLLGGFIYKVRVNVQQM